MNPTKDSRFSTLARRLDRGDSGAWAVHEEALRRRRRGEDVILLSIGDPDFRTPEPIIDNAVSHLRVGRTHYSPALGELNLRRAVADYETRVSPHRCTSEQIAIFPGVTAAIYAVMSCLIDPGDELIVIDPMYVGYEPILTALDAHAQIIAAQPINGFVPTLEQFESAVTSKTRLVFVNTPSNPTGAIMGADLLAELAAFCQQRNIWLVCDEVYSMFTFDKPHRSLRSAAERLDQLVIIDGLSKSHAMSGWRVGWVVAEAQLIHHLGNFAAMSLFGSPQFIQDAAAFALNNDEYYVREMRNCYRERRDRVCARLDRMSALQYHKPGAGMFIMIDVRAVEADDRKFAQRLLDAEALSLLPGVAFGKSTEGHVRFSLVQPMEVLMAGCDRLERFIGQL